MLQQTVQLSISKQGPPLPGDLLTKLQNLLQEMGPKASYSLITSIEKRDGLLGICIENTYEKSLQFVFKTEAVFAWKCLLTWSGNFSGEHLAERMKSINASTNVESKQKSVVATGHSAPVAPLPPEPLKLTAEVPASPAMESTYYAPIFKSVIATEKSTKFFFARVLEVHPNGVVSFNDVSTILVRDFGYTKEGAKSTWQYLVTNRPRFVKKIKKSIWSVGIPSDQKVPNLAASTPKPEEAASTPKPEEEDPCDVIEKQMERLQSLAFFTREEGRAKLCDEILANTKACKEALEKLRKRKLVRP